MSWPGLPSPAAPPPPRSPPPPGIPPGLCFGLFGRGGGALGGRPARGRLGRGGGCWAGPGAPRLCLVGCPAGLVAPALLPPRLAPRLGCPPAARRRCRLARPALACRGFRPAWVAVPLRGLARLRGGRHPAAPGPAALSASPARLGGGPRGHRAGLRHTAPRLLAAAAAAAANKPRRGGRGCGPPARGGPAAFPPGKSKEWMVIVRFEAARPASASGAEDTPAPPADIIAPVPVVYLLSWRRDPCPP